MKMGPAFYPLYLSYIEDASDGLARLKDLVEEKSGKSGKSVLGAEKLNRLIDGLTSGGEDFTETAKNFLSRLKGQIRKTGIITFFAEAVESDEIMNLKRFRFLLAVVILENAFHK